MHKRDNLLREVLEGLGLEIDAGSAAVKRYVELLLEGISVRVWLGTILPICFTINMSMTPSICYR